MNNIPSKPPSVEEQISTLWDAVYSLISKRLVWQDMKINFILGFTALILGLLGILIVLVIR